MRKTLALLCLILCSPALAHGRHDAPASAQVAPVDALTGVPSRQEAEALTFEMNPADYAARMTRLAFDVQFGSAVDIRMGDALLTIWRDDPSIRRLGWARVTIARTATKVTISFVRAVKETAVVTASR